MQFDNIDEILEILLCSDKSYAEIEDYCEKLFPAIAVLHKSSLGNEYPSKYTQCILECYKLKNGYTSTVWYSNNHLDKNSINNNSGPIEFSRINSKGDILKYILYNGDLINNPNNANKTNSEAPKIQNILLEESCLNNIEIEKFKDFNLRYLILKAMKFDAFTRYTRDINFVVERFGLISEEVLTLEDVGILHSLSRERVRQIIERAFRKFKYRLFKATKESLPNFFELSIYLDKIVELLDNQKDKNFSASFIEQFIEEEFGKYSPAYLQLINKLTNKNYSINLPKFTNIQDALLAIDSVLILYNEEVYSADFFAKVLEIKNRKAVVVNDEVNLTLNNLLYVYSTKRKNIFYKNIDGLGYLTNNNENLKNIENLPNKSKMNDTFLSNIDKNNSKIRRAILYCIKEFSGKYGKSGIAKILKGSKSIKDSIYNKNAISSSFYGMFEQLTLSFIEKEIDKLVDEEYLEVKKVNYGRPLLLTSAKAESYIDKNMEEDSELKENDECYKNEHFIQIINYMKEKANIFITGHAGTGKSYILNKLKEKYPDIVITSTTGIAAVNVKGQTLHSWAGVGICNHSIDYVVKKILSKNSLKNQIQKCKILAIDEISMLNITTFEYVDKVLRIIRACDEPFGGIQVLFIGDFFQLPPVEEDSQKEQKYCFESPVWKELNLKNIVLDKNYRQSEQNLITALSNMRTNNLTENDIKLLKTREIANDCNLENMLHIYSTNEEADNYNNKMFAKIKEKEVVLTSFDGIYRGTKLVDTPETEREHKLLERIDVTCRAEKNVILKIGARVMLLTNLDFEKGLINGSCGIVKDICEDYVLVLFDNGNKFKIKQHDFEFYSNNKIIAIRKQYPLRLAYGITIHKSQGMSLDNLVVDCSRIFERGQAYVAISRIKKLDGLYLNNFNPANVIVDDKVVEFYKNLV